MTILTGRHLKLHCYERREVALLPGVGEVVAWHPGTWDVPHWSDELLIR